MRLISARKRRQRGPIAPSGGSLLVTIPNGTHWTGGAWLVVDPWPAVMRKLEEMRAGLPQVVSPRDGNLHVVAVGWNDIQGDRQVTTGLIPTVHRLVP